MEHVGEPTFESHVLHDLFPTSLPHNEMISQLTNTRPKSREMQEAVTKVLNQV